MMTPAGRHRTTIAGLGFALVAALCAPTIAAADEPSPTFCDEEGSGVGDLTYTSDESAVLYTTIDGIWITDRDGERRPFWTEPVSLDSVHADPTGSHIAAVGLGNADLDLNRTIWLLDANAEVQAVLDTIAFDPELAWSPVDSRFVIVDAGLSPADRLVVFDADNLDDPVVVSTVPSRQPAWSPDGSQLAWLDEEILFVGAADGSSRSVIAIGDDAGAAEWAYPSWSPDGSRLAWAGFDADDDGQMTVFTADPDGGNRRALPVEIERLRFPAAWSPDGSRLAVVDERLDDRLWVLEDAEGGDSWDAPALASHAPAWSPDGSTLAWSDPFGGLVLGDPDGTASRVIDSPGTDPFRHSFVQWSADGTQLLARGSLGFTAHVFLIEADGSGRRMLSSGATEGTYEDFFPTSFAYDDVGCLTGLAITTGTADFVYSPAEFVSRAQMASFLARTWRVTGRDCPAGDAPFVDVAASSFAAEDVDCIFGLGITNGTSATTYSPGQSVNRAQMASFLARLWRATGAECPTDAAPFVDVAASSFAANDVDCIFGLGITNGTSATTYSPGQPVTREQMGAFLARLLRLVSQP